MTNPIRPIIVEGSQVAPIELHPGIRAQRLVAQAKQGARLSLSVVEFDPGKGEPWHDHQDKDTVATVIEGNGVYWVMEPGGPKSVECGAGDAVFSPAWSCHKMTNPYGKPLKVVASQYPSATGG